MKGGHGIHMTHVMVKSRSIGIIRYDWILQKGQWIVDPVQVMVEEDQPGIKASLAECRDQVQAKEFLLLFQVPGHAWGII